MEEENTMVHKRTKLAAAALAAAAVMILAVIGVHAATITPSTPEITLKEKDTTVSFQVILKADQDFAGAEFGLKPSSDEVGFSSLTWSDTLKNESVLQTEKSGNLYFGFFAGTNKFKAGEYTVGTLTYSYSGDKEQSIRLVSSKIVRLDESGKTAADTSSKEFTVTLKRQAATPDKPSVTPSKPKMSKVTGVKVSGKKKAVAVSWKKVSKASGYQIAYSKSKKFSKAKYKSVSKSSKKTVIRKLSKKKRYYVKVRAWQTVSGKKYYGSWSSAKSARAR